MLVTVQFPWNVSARINRTYDVFEVQAEPSNYEGEIYTGGVATSVVDGTRIPLPPYLAEKDLAGTILGLIGVDHNTSPGGKLD